MKNMILHIAITTLLASMSACSDEMDPERVVIIYNVYIEHGVRFET